MTNRTGTPWNSGKGNPRQDQPQVTSSTVANGGCDLCVPQSWECTLRVNLYNPRCEEDIVHQSLEQDSWENLRIGTGNTAAAR